MTNYERGPPSQAAGASVSSDSLRIAATMKNSEYGNYLRELVGGGS